MKIREIPSFRAMSRVLIIVGLIGMYGAPSLAQPKDQRITLDNLLRTLEAGKHVNRLPVKRFVALLDKNKVDFQLTDEDEEKIRALGAYYGPRGLATILAAVRRNFRSASADNSPLQVQYRLVAGNSIDFFLSKTSKKDWEMLDIDGKVSIVPNDTYKTLSQLAMIFSVPFTLDYFDFRNPDRTRDAPDASSSRNTELASSYIEQGRKIFIGSGGGYNFPGIHMPVPDLIKSLEDPTKPWRIYLDQRVDDDFGSPLLKERDLSQLTQFCQVLTGSESQPSEYKAVQSRLEPLTFYIRDHLSSSTNGHLENCNAVTRDLLKPLIADLNRILQGPDIYEEAYKRGPNSSPPDPTNSTLPNQLQEGEEMIRLNRKHLVKAFPDFIRNESEYSFVFVKQVQRQDFAQLDSPLTRFYEHITQSNLPADFGYIEIRIGAGNNSLAGCEAGNQPYQISGMVAPYLALWIAVFENVTDKPIRVGNFALRENLSYKLRTREEDANILNSQVVKQVPLYPFGMLRPNEKIIIPLELVLMYREDIKALFSLDPDGKVPSEFKQTGKPSTQLTTTEEEKPLRKRAEVSLPSGRIGTATLLDILRRPRLTFGVDRKYRYGPSVKIDNVEVNKARYLVRSFNPDRPIITSSGYLGGSCPFVYTYDLTKKSWTNEGVVMAGFDAKSKEAMDVKLLGRFDGRILLEEKEAEDSFIDFLQVRARTADGKEILLHPKNELLLTIDGKYLMLRQGERLIVEFDVPNEIQALEYRLEVSGYYIPHEISARKRIQ